ncbi:DUF5074 domain-containing protein [Winogradskyella sp.]|uniref:YncE family protein n=1 Tax=Winogradskyella sp. TaxID=1883156 RepID=UPI00262C7361|nr:DUF5074 domain-containing protein [Winogradskyella sp.]
MKHFSFRHSVSFLAIVFSFISCTSEDRETPIDPPPLSGDYSNGVFILNEGNFGSVNASVSFLDESDQVFGNIFSNVNSANLGDTAQSMGFNGDNAYIVVNNSATVEVVNRNTFDRIATVTDMLVNPRYIVFSGNNGYISNWGDPNNINDDYIAVLNLETNLVESTISVVEGPERLLINNGKLYVAHKGGFGYGNTISVIDLEAQNVIESIPVADVPDGLVITNGSLYVTCTGKLPFTQDETIGGIFKIDTADATVESSLMFPEGIHPNSLEYINNTLYYTVENAMFNIKISNFQLPSAPLFEASDNGLEILYGFNVHNGNIYVADAKDYISNGEVFIYSLDGVLQNQFNVAIIPNSFYFNNL